MNRPPVDEELSRTPRRPLGWYRFSWFATLVGSLWLILALLMAIDLSGAPDPYVVANLSPLVVPILVVGLVTLGLQPRGGWLALVGIFGFVVGVAYLLTTIGFFHYGSPLPAPGLLKIVGIGAFFVASIAAVGVGLASSRSALGRGLIIVLVLFVGLILLGVIGPLLGLGR